MDERITPIIQGGKSYPLGGDGKKIKGVILYGSHAFWQSPPSPPTLK